VDGSNERGKVGTPSFARPSSWRDDRAWPDVERTADAQPHGPLAQHPDFLSGLPARSNRGLSPWCAPAWPPTGSAKASAIRKACARMFVDASPESSRSFRDVVDTAW